MVNNVVLTCVVGVTEIAGYIGYYTNHSLRATCATCLFGSGIDEQLIMNRTGHYSKESVRACNGTIAKLNELASDVLNGVDARDKVKEGLQVLRVVRKNTLNPLMVMKRKLCTTSASDSGGTNININFGSIPKLQ